MTNPTRKLYREFLRIIKHTTTKNLHERMKRKVRYHFEGNSLRNSETCHDIALGYRIIQIIKERKKEK
jgi:hypothetical protein